jgi:ABC-type transport system involved in Fe-S cluster assembly fused permease/ATPase subunit
MFAEAARVMRDIISLVWTSADRFVQRRLVLGLAMVAIGSAIAALAPVALKLLVDAFDKPGTSPSVFVLVIAYVLTHWAARVLGELRGYVDAQVDRRMYRALSGRLFSHILDLPLRFHLDRRTGALSETLTNGLAGYQIVMQHTIYTVLPVGIELTIVSLVLIKLDQAVFLILFVFALGAYAAVFTYGMSRITAAAEEASSSQIDERAVMTDSIINYETVKYFTAETLVRTQFERALQRTEAEWMRFFRTKTANGILISSVFAVFMALTTLYAARQVMRGAMSIGDFVLVNAYILQLARPVETLGYAVQGFAQGIAFLEKMLDLLNIAPERSTQHGGELKEQGALRFENVSVGYHIDRRVLSNVSFTLPAGKTLGIVGASGAGKSTLVRLLVRLLEPDHGQILLDGTPINDISLQELRRAVAVVPQDTVLFNDTLYYNIAFARPDCTEQEVHTAAHLARLHDFIVSLPQGYATNVGERGLKLSGGEKQRVSIARAALKRPRIYVFDEATSSLDSRTEAEILANLREIAMSSTTLIIAHRLSTIVHADQILVFEEGRIVECGDHVSLVAADGKYAALWKAQQRSPVVASAAH